MSAAAPAASATERAATGLLSLFYVPRSLVVHCCALEACVLLSPAASLHGCAKQ